MKKIFDIQTEIESILISATESIPDAGPTFLEWLKKNKNDEWDTVLADVGKDLMNAAGWENYNTWLKKNHATYSLLK